MPSIKNKAEEGKEREEEEETREGVVVKDSVKDKATHLHTGLSHKTSGSMDKDTHSHTGVSHTYTPG